MRVHFPSIAAIVVALLFVSGTVGCRNHGGNWYDPRSYSFVNPFDRDGQSSRSTDTFANARPSLGAHPDISIPPGGYSDASSLAGRSGTTTSPLGGQASEPWGQQHQMGSHTPPNHLGGFTVAEPSHLPTYTPSQGHMMAGQQPFGSPHNHMAAVPQQHMPHQHASPHNQFQQDIGQHHMGHQQQHAGQQHMGQQHIGQQHIGQPHHMGHQQNPAPFGPSDYMQAGFHHPVQHHMPTGLHGSIEQQSNHAPFGVMPHDPHGAAHHHQPVTVPPAGFGFEHPPAHTPQQHIPQQGGFPGDGGFHQQHHQPPHQPLHQPPPAGGFPPPASTGFNHW